MGVVHGDELQYIFADIWGEDLSMSSADIKFTKNQNRFWLKTSSLCYISLAAFTEVYHFEQTSVVSYYLDSFKSLDLLKSLFTNQSLLSKISMAHQHYFIDIKYLLLLTSSLS